MLLATAEYRACTMADPSRRRREGSTGPADGERLFREQIAANPLAEGDVTEADAVAR